MFWLILQIKTATMFKKNYLTIWKEKRNLKRLWIILLILNFKYSFSEESSLSLHYMFKYFFLNDVSIILRWSQK